MAVVELNSENFESTINDNSFVIVDFWASWCGPCKQFAPVYDQVSEKYPDVVFGKINTEEQQDLAMQFQIRSIPTLMIFRDQIIIYSQPGAMAAASFENLITQASALDMNEVRAKIAQEAETKEA